MFSELGSPPPDDDIERRRVVAEAEAMLFGTPRTPILIGRFEIRRRLGTGGQGVVYVAFDPELDREVALKLLRAARENDDASADRQRMLREARAMARLAHPNVVHVYEVGVDEDRIFIAMEHVAGSNARAWLAAAKRDWRAVVRIYLDAGRGLAAAHAAGIVHRDVKPENILVGDDRARIADFGIADDPGLAGTPRYMAPEQRAGAPTAASDQYALARALDEALPPGAPPRIRRALARAVATDPMHRFPTLADFLASLEAALGHRTLRSVGWTALAVVLAIALVGAIIQFWMFRNWMNQTG